MGRVLIKGGVWRNTEDEILKAAVMKYGKNQWSRIASLLHRKSSKQCKARWFEWLDPSIKKTEWSREEEEKLINLVRLMPTQWRTIASIVGRTATQCLEHYEQLLDQVQNKDGKDGNLDDPRKLKPGEIDPNPETKPARPDPKDMDEDELEMLSEARARLANTQGKKAKRKAREKQLEEARRLASLQKRRELRLAGINLSIRNFKHKRHIDYNNEIPFEKPVPKGFHDTTNDVYDPSGHDFKKLRQQQLDGELKSEKEERERKKDKQKMKQKKENGVPSSLVNNEPIRPRSKLVLPEPVISDNEIEQVVKMGKASELAKESAEESGNVASGALLADYSTLSNSVSNIRTPKMSSFSRDNILMEAQNLMALNNVDTPLMGGQNVPLIDIPEHSAATPAGLIASQTPNSIIATPFRSSHGTQQPGAVVPFSPSQTPGTSRQGGFATPMSTPLRDKLAINSEDAVVPFNSDQDLKRQNKQLKENLQKAFSELPAPQYQYDIVVEDVKPEDEQNDADNGDSEMMDQSEVDSLQRQAKRAKVMRDEKWTKAVQQNAPRPSNVRKSLWTSSSTSGAAVSLLSQAEDLIKDEMTKMLYFDALVNPTDEQTVFAGIESKKAPAKPHDELLANYLDEHPLEQFSGKELAEATNLLNEEMKTVQAGMKHGDLSLHDYSKVWDECFAQLLYLPTQNRYTKADIVSKRDRIEAIDHRLGQNREHMSKEAKKAGKIEKKLSVLYGGYHSRAKEFSKQYQEIANQIEQSRLELTSFTALKVNENNAIVKRVGALNEDVQRQNEREKNLQSRYDQLLRRREELMEQLQAQQNASSAQVEETGATSN
ncbi:CDC5 cell division cycle 5-like protein [Tyrophagus putrescentiae]|nr:CDC5 cell division cycle 5-like protein [Tyrophagus putrescentiae]